MTRLTQADSMRNLSGYPTSVVPSVPKQLARWLTIRSTGWPAPGALSERVRDYEREPHHGESYIIHTEHIGVIMLCEGAYVRQVLYDVSGDDSDARRRVYAEGLAKFLAVPAGPSGSS